MPFEMRIATQSDVAGMVSVYFSAFSTTLIGRQTFPETSASGLLFWTDALIKGLEDPHAHIFVVTDSEPGKPDEVIAFAKWVAPGAPYEEVPPLEAWPEDGNPTLALTFFTAMAKAHERIMGDKPHWYLELVAVRKDWIGKGAASPLMRWGVEQADIDGTPCFLEGTPNARAMYEKYGFRVVGEDEFESPEGSITEYYMVRDSKRD